MSDFYQNGVVTVLHRLGQPNVDQLERELVRYGRVNPLALVLDFNDNKSIAAIPAANADRLARAAEFDGVFQDVPSMRNWDARR